MRISRLIMVLIVEATAAFCVSSSWAAPCVVPPISEAAIKQFKVDPAAIVALGSDTRVIEAQVRDLVGTSPALAVDMIRVAQTTNRRFQTAIAAGLAQAAVACNNLDQQAALQIQQAVANYNDGQFQSSFAAVAGDLSTAAIAAANESAVGAVGSVVVVNPNTSSRPTTNPGGGGTTALVAITSSVVTVGNGTTSISATTTAANPVSPTH
jgi:hypothetical protein